MRIIIADDSEIIMKSSIVVEILGAYRLYWVLTDCIYGEVAGSINLVTAAWGVNLITKAL